MLKIGENECKDSLDNVVNGLKSALLIQSHKSGELTENKYYHFIQLLLLDL
jgi:hypothetical protein